MDFRQLKKCSCPICNGVSRGPGRGGGECKENVATGVVHCRTGLELSQLPPGWKFIREDRSGFGMFAQEVEDPELGQQRWEEARQRQEAERQRRLAQQRESLTLEERDNQFRELLAQGGLFQIDKEDLQRRGLDDLAIARGKFVTVQRGMYFYGIDPRLPGIAGGMRQYLGVGGDGGYLCPAWDVRGRIVGAQVRMRTVENGKKYPWLKSKFSSHLPNGELPITVCRPPLNSPNKPQDIGLIEGILKPWVASQLSGRIFIGASGGNFRSSPEQLRKTLAALSEDKKRLQITLFPDANGVGNPQVYARDCETIKLIRSWGYRVRVADWGQLYDKSQPDYDEMLANGNAQIVRYISGGDYLKLRPDLDRKKRQKNAASMQHKLKKIVADRTQVYREQYIKIDPHSIPENSIFAIKSPPGSGKTEALKKIYRCYSDANVLSYRNGLLINTAERLKEVGDVGYLWDLVAEDFRYTDAFWKNFPWVLSCIDSIAKLSVRDTLILEEADKVFSHVLYGKTCERNRPTILALLEKHIRGAKRVILLDADLTGVAIRYVAGMDPSKKTYLLHNVFPAPKWKVYSYQGAYDDKGNNKANCRRPLEKQIISAIESGKKPLIVSDSQKWLEGFCNLLSDMFPETTHLRVDSRTKADEAELVDNFLSKPNQWLESNQPAWVTLSPTAESSLDITSPYFDIVFGHFSGVVPHWSAQQMLARYRRPVDRVIFCTQSGFHREGESRSFYPSGVAKDLLRHNFVTVEKIALKQYLEQQQNLGASEPDTLCKALAAILDPSTGEWNNPHLKAYTEYKALENYSLAYLRESIEEALAESGHEVIPVFETDSKTGVQEACDLVLRSQADAISKAEDIEVSEAYEILRDMSATSDRRFAAQKALLRERLPGINLTADFIYQYRLKDRNKLGRLQCLWMIDHPEVQYQIDRQKWRNSLIYGSKLWDIHTHSLTVSVLNDLGVLDFIDPAKEWSAHSSEVTAFKEKALTMNGKLKLLNINVFPNSDPCYLLRRCLEKVGVTLRVQQRWVGSGQRARFYSIAPLTTEEQAILEAYDRRFAPYLASQTAPLENILRVQSVMPAASPPVGESPPGSPAGVASGRLVSILEKLERGLVKTSEGAANLWKEAEQLIANGVLDPFPGFWDRMGAAMGPF